MNRLKLIFQAVFLRGFQALKTALRTLDTLHLACSWSLKTELITCGNILQESADILQI